MDTHDDCCPNNLPEEFTLTIIPCEPEPIPVVVKRNGVEAEIGRFVWDCQSGQWDYLGTLRFSAKGWLKFKALAAQRGIIIS